MLTAEHKLIVYSAGSVEAKYLFPRFALLSVSVASVSSGSSELAPAVCC
jgi:hypothetical protein